MAEEKKSKPQGLQIKVPDELRGGVYSNLVIINHSPDEFTMDFIFVQPGTPHAEVRSRVILSPTHAKRFLAALTNNIGTFEAMFGTIRPAPTPPPAQETH